MHHLSMSIQTNGRYYLFVNFNNIVAKFFKFRNNELVLKRLVNYPRIFSYDGLKGVKIQFHAAGVRGWRMGVEPV